RPTQRANHVFLLGHGREGEEERDGALRARVPADQGSAATDARLHGDLFARHEIRARGAGGGSEEQGEGVGLELGSPTTWACLRREILQTFALSPNLDIG